MLEKTLESPLDCEEIQPVHPKGKQSLLFIGRIDAEAETKILWPLMQRTDSFEKTLMLGKIEGRRSGWQMVGWQFGQAKWDSEGQQSLACWSPWGCRELDRTEQLVGVGQDFATEQHQGISVVLKLKRKSFCLHAALYDSGITNTPSGICYLLCLIDHSPVHFLPSTINSQLYSNCGPC